MNTRKTRKESLEKKIEKAYHSFASLMGKNQ
jgi:hypothetical protein